MKRALPIICMVSLIIGCAIPPTKPNISAIYWIQALKPQLQPLPTKSHLLAKEPLPEEVQTSFQQLYTIDPALALEVGKLPEFQDKIGQRQILALARFTGLVEKATPEEKANLAKLLHVGKPAFRRYCTPLQAIFWLLEIENYKERDISQPSIYRATHAWDLTEEDLAGQDHRRDFKGKGKDKNLLQRSLYWILEHTWDFNEKDRWSDFKIVTERLNSPELINYYERCNFSYVSHGECPGFAKLIFRSKEGCCSDFTAFSEYCLRKAGYDARAIKVVSPTGKLYHVVCEYDENGKTYIMDNSCRSCGSRKGITEKKIYTKELPHIGFGYM